MHRFRSALAALLSLSLLAGCVTAGRPPKGEYRPYQYQTCATEPRIGRVAVTFAADSKVKPDLQWQLFATGQTTGWRSVLAAGDPWSLPKLEQPYGIEFRWTPGGKNPVHCPERPLESRMIRVLEKQCLNVQVAFE